VVALIVLLVLVALLVCGLERSHRRRSYPRVPTAGRSDVQDRDSERVRAELRLAGEDRN